MFLALSPVVVFSVIVGLIAVRQHGLGAGLLVAIVCGLTYDALIIPMYGCLIVLYAFLCPAVGRFALLPATLGALIYLLLCGDDTALLALAPSLAAGVLLDTVIARLQEYWQQIHYTAATDGDPLVRQDPTKQQLMLEIAHHDALLNRLSNMSGAFSHLSEVFRQLLDQPTLRKTSEVRDLCEQSLESICADCPNNSTCYDRESLSILNTLHVMSRALQSEGQIGEECLAEHLREHCPRKRSILADVNDRINRLNYDALHSSQGEQFAFCCDEIAHLLRDLTHTDERAEDEKNLTLSDAITQYLNRNNISARQIVVSGQDKKAVRILGITPAALTISQTQLQEEISKILHARVSKLHYDGADDGTLSLFTLPRWRVDYVHRVLAANQAKTKEKKRPACGDTLRVFEAKDGIFCALLCDGMGHGTQAASISGICGVFLEQVLRAGVGVNTALRMLNHYLLSRIQSPEDEISSTVDLFMLNLYTGQGQFVKSGAAASLILRDDRLFRLSSHTLPIGILHAVDTQILPFEAQAGDHILLMSDGIADSEGAEREQDWLIKSLQSRDFEDDSALLNHLFSKARENGSKDDMSMISIRVSKEELTK
jgi:stage II sporulation protein E